MNLANPPFRAVVLAGERPGGSAFSRELGLPAGVLVDVAGQSALARVLAALTGSTQVDGGILCGPSEEIYRAHPVFRDILAGTGFQWLAPDPGPSASALKGVRHVARYPLLLTAGDHALLTPELVDDFCSRARVAEADVVVGLVPYSEVRRAFPESRRTVLKFSDGEFCGSNLFAIRDARGEAALAFWSRLEADRKRPWRMARRIGPGMLLRYVFGRLTLARALHSLSGAIGCTVAHVAIDNPRAAVDVDSIADRDLAEKILGG
jgi:molybdopterin-guanine dinucleotide biosynthesis protein A